MADSFALVALIAILVLAPVFAAPLKNCLRLVLRSCMRVARHQALALLTVALVAAGASAVVSTWVERPLPTVHDEFSYLLSADTFASGRATNPTHALWRAFETFHVIQQPTYASKYPPGQGLALAFGIVLANDPLVGVWLSSGVLAAALFWMLRAWLPGSWALLGTLLAICQFGVASYWSQSYWGGAVCASGGALIFGALRRLQRGYQIRDGLLLGLGLCVVAATRPVEGILASLPVAFTLLYGIAVAGRDSRAFARAAPSLLAIAIVGSSGLVAIAKYNAVVTGDPLSFAYQVHEDAYASAPPFLWMSSIPQPRYRHAVMRKFWTGAHALKSYSEKRTAIGTLERIIDRLRTTLLFFVGYPMMLALLAIRGVLSDRQMRVPLIATGLVCTLSLGATWYSTHYVAPIAGCLILIATSLLRRTAQIEWRGRPIGAALACGIVLAAPIALALQVQSRVGSNTGFARTRAGILETLEADEQRHLILVRYGPRHSAHEEFVYNQADIDGAKVVWARSTSPDEDERLIDYFFDRQVWQLETGFEKAQPVSLQPLRRAAD